MKNIAIGVATLIFSLQSFAFPAANDAANMSGTISVNGEAFSARFEQKFLEAKNNGEDLLYSSQFYIDGDLASDENEWRKTKDVISPELVTLLLAYCTQQGGVNESVTVPAGTFDTCKLPIEEGSSALNLWAAEPGLTGFIWIGMVPFGLVKLHQVDFDGQTTITYDLEIDSFVDGQ